MIFIDDMKNFKIYRTKTFLPTLKNDKKKGSAILLMTPNFDSSKRLMNHNMFINSNRFQSYYLEKDVSYYINGKKVEEIDEEDIIEEQTEITNYLETARSELNDSEFGVSSKRKFPLDTEKHVRSAVKFFNYVDPADEEELAEKLISKLKKYNINVKVSEKNKFSKYYKPDKSISESVNIEESTRNLTELDYLSESMVNNLPTNSINLGDKVIFFNEANVNDTQLKKLLYQSRIKKRKDQLILFDTVKTENPWIKYTFTDINRYTNRNLFVDLYYYSSIFFENNTWVIKKGFNLYLDFIQRLINHPTLKSAGYNKKTIFIPVKDWDKTHDGMIWNYKKSINPISCIYQLMYDGRTEDLKKVFGDCDVLFVGNNYYFKINFSKIDAKEAQKLSVRFKILTIKMCTGENFSEEDIDSSADNKETSEVIAAKIVDKIEVSKGIDLTKNVAKSTSKLAVKKDTNNITSKGISTSKMSDMTFQKYKNKKLTIDNIDDEEDFSVENSEKEEDISKLADAIVKASETGNTEDEALDIMDDEETRRLLISLGDDNDVDISASRSTRMTNLNNALMDKEVNGRSVKDILNSEKKEDVTTTVDVASPNTEEWSNLSYMNLDKDYDIDKDILGIFELFSTCSRPMVVKDINVTDNSTSEDRLMLYDVTMEDYKGKRHRIKIDIPIMEDNRFLLRGDRKSLQTQFFNMPIIKTDLDTCQLISNYRKIFLERFGDSRGKSLPAVTKFLKAINKYTGNKIKISYGNNTKICSKYNLPMDYIDICGTISKIESSDWIIYFNQDEIRDLYKVDDSLGTPYIYNKKLNAIEYFVYKSSDTTFISTMSAIVFTACPEIEELYGSVTRSSGSAFTRAYIMQEDIPLAMICAYHIGLRSTMDRAGVKYEIVNKLSKETKADVTKDWIEFDDGYVVYDVNYESSLLMSGLKSRNCPTELFSIGDMDDKKMYLEFMTNFGGRIKADGLDNFYDLFVDPMTKEALEYYKLPTDYIDILLYGSSMLADNKYTKHTDTSSRRLRRYQLISAYAYIELADAYGKYMTTDKHTNNPTFAVKQSCVIDKMLTDNISSDDSCLNALRDIETTNAITTKGPSGMNSDRAYTLDKRAYDDSMVNVLGMSTGFAGNVGITRQATINSNVTSEGYVKSNEKEMNDANTLTATESLIPFGSTRDDPMRTAMSFIQTSKHMVRTEDSDPLLVTSGADEVMPYLTTDRFAYKAKEDGKVLEAAEDYIIIEYKSGKREYISFKETIEKNSDGGYYVPLKLDPTEKYKVGMKFNKDKILAYDKYSFSNKVGESNNIAYNIGKLAKVAILNTDEGFEDAGIISASMAKKLATRVNIKFDAVVNKDSRIFSIAKVGEHIEASDPLLIWEDAFDDADAEGVMSGLIGDEFSEVGKRKLLSEVTGTITDIKIFRTVELDDLSPSIKKVVSAYEKPLKEQAAKLEANNISSKTIPAHYKLAPTGKLKRAQEAIFIEFYVEYMDTVGTGDKIVYNSANKAVEKGLFPEGKEPYTAFRPNEKIDAFVADTAISKRLVTSTYVYGGIQKLLVELDRSVKDIMGIPYDDSTV